MCVSACFSTQKVRADMHAACVCAVCTACLTNPHSAMTLSLMFPLNHTEEPNPEAYGNYTHLHLSAHMYCTHTYCLCSHRFTEGVRKLQFGESARAFLASFYNTSSPMVGMTICLHVVSFVGVGVSACARSRACRGALHHPVMCDFFSPQCFLVPVQAGRKAADGGDV